MLELMFLTVGGSGPLAPVTSFPCDGVRRIEVASVEQPRPFASLRSQVQATMQGARPSVSPARRQPATTNVTQLNGFSNCRFVYTSQIDLACYGAQTELASDAEAIADLLTKTAESVGQCLTNKALVRIPSEEGSTPSIGFGGGPMLPFWQVSVVPMDADPGRVHAEVLVLGPAEVQRRAPGVRPARAVLKAKRKSR